MTTTTTNPVEIKLNGFILMNTGLPSIEYDHIVATATPHIFINESYTRDWRTTHPDVRTC